MALAVFAPIHQLLVFGDGNGFLDAFDVLKGFGFGFSEFEFVSAIGTVGEFEFDDFVDQFWCDGCSEMLFVPGLGSDFSFLRFAVFVFGLEWFDDVAGRRFGRVAGVLFEKSNFRFELCDLFKCGVEQCFALCIAPFKFCDSSILGIHDAVWYSFSPVDERAILPKITSVQS